MRQDKPSCRAVVAAPRMEIAAFFLMATFAHAGVEVVLTVSPQQATYLPSQTVQVDVSLSQKPGGADQLLRMVEVDFQATSPSLAIALPVTHDRGTTNTGDDVRFWQFASLLGCAASPSFCGFNHYVDDQLAPGPVDARTPMLSAAYYGLQADSTAQLLLRSAGTPLYVGTMQVTLPALDGDYTLDLLNAGNTAAYRGARVDFGYEPHTIWRAGNIAPNDVTGGRVVLHVSSTSAISALRVAPVVTAGDALDDVRLCPTPSKVPCDVTPCATGSDCTGLWGFGAKCTEGFCRDRCGQCYVPDCNDNNPCTDDAYVAGACVPADNANPCDDHDVCTTNDRCVGGACLGLALSCDDANACTDDTCNPASGCVHSNNTAPCDDGLFCNGADTCSDGLCAAHSGDPCPSNAACDEATRRCIVGPLFSLKAVKKNGLPIAPTNSLIVAPGDTIETEFLVSRWGSALPGGVVLYQVTIDAPSFGGGSNGTILPLGWNAPPGRMLCTPPNTCQGGLNSGQVCTGNANCPGGVCGTASCLAASANYPLCLQDIGGFACVAAGHNPDLGAFIDASRPNYVFFGDTVIADVSTASLWYGYFSIRDSYGGVPDTGAAKYCGTLILRVSNNACGTFTIGFEGYDRSLLADGHQPPNVIYPASQALVLTARDCVTQLVDCHPGVSADHCDIDARIPHHPTTPVQRLTTNQVVLEFDRSSAGMTPTDFDVSLFPNTGVLPAVSSVQLNTPTTNEAVVTLNRRISREQWTCVRHKLSNRHCCFASMPADADGNQVSYLGDIFEVLANLQGMVNPALPIQRCDIDRDSVCGPADLLLTADLLVGADLLPTMNGRTLPSCPPFRLYPWYP